MTSTSMRPSELTAKSFTRYPPEARKLAESYLKLFRELPLVFLPLLLQQLIAYDWMFPAERRQIEQQLIYLSSLSDGALRRVLAGFSRLRLSRALDRTDWTNLPDEFAVDLSGYLWSSGQQDAFREAATEYMSQFYAWLPAEPVAMPRLGIVILGQGVDKNSYPLFRNLRPNGTYFTHVNPENGVSTLLDAVKGRASRHPAPFAHWYIDGGAEEPGTGPEVTRVSYAALAPVRQALLKKVDHAIRSGIGGPEALRTMLYHMRPEEIGLSGAPSDAVMSHFQASLLTEGSGTQIFSTTFVQWTAREAWARAQPVTLLARFAPRQRQRPMNELLSGKDRTPEPDPMSSLIDADMGAYYIWLEQQRLPGAAQSAFVAWFENHSEAVVVSPTLPRNTQSDTPVDLSWLMKQAV